MTAYRLSMGGKDVDAASGATFEVLDPFVMTI
jgi:hypothetical protein